MHWVVGILVFAATGLAAWAGISLVVSDERMVARWRGSLSAYESGQAAAAHPALQPFRDRILAPMGQRVADAAVSAAPTGYRARLKQRLVLAGSPRGMGVARFMDIKILAGLAIGALCVAVAALADGSSGVWLFGIAFTAAAFHVPDMWLSNAIAERRSRIRREIPDFLDMLTISVEAGLGFDAAIAKLVRTTHGPLAQEFARMLQQVQVGVDRVTALKGMSQRTEVPELDSFISSVIQAETFGISIANVLRTQAKEMRLKRRQYAEERAQKVPVKIIFPIVLCILPATMIIVLGPAVVSIGKAFGLL
jgi:tight adherence protein C